MDRKPVKWLPPAPVARRAVAGAARGDEPALSARARALQLARPLLEELLHRRRRRPQDLGALLAAAAAQARDRGGAGLAGGAARACRAGSAASTRRWRTRSSRCGCSATPTITRWSWASSRRSRRSPSRTADAVHYQPCPSPVWDTALAVNALVESDVPADHPALRRAAEWMIECQVLVPGDWQVKRPHVQPGRLGVPVPTTTSTPTSTTPRWSLMALEKVQGLDADRGAAGQGARARLVPRDAGHRRRLGVLRRRQQPPLPEPHPVRRPRRAARSVHGGSDRARASSCSARSATGRTSSPPQRAIDFLRHAQRHDGPWYGRWGVNYIYGTWSVLRGLAAIGEDPRHEYVQRAVRWLERHQNQDGGWGETCESYDDHEFAGVGQSTPSQTAWALLGALRRRAHERPGRRARHRLPARARSAPTARGRTRSGTARASRGSST